MNMADLFPITTTITEDDLKGSITIPWNCPGARSLKRVLKEKEIDTSSLQISWMFRSGDIIDEGKLTRLYSDADMLYVTAGQVVTFSLTKFEQYGTAEAN